LLLLLLLLYISQILWDDSSRQYVLPYKHLTKLGEVRTEVQLLDAADNWAFLGWLLDERRMQVRQPLNYQF
jgi:hypothetical protein